MKVLYAKVYQSVDFNGKTHTFLRNDARLGLADLNMTATQYGILAVLGDKHVIVPFTNVASFALENIEDALSTLGTNKSSKLKQ